MKYDDLSFNLINDDGLDVICDVTSVIPNPDDSDDIYVTFTDYTMDENGDFVTYYAHVIETDYETQITKITDPEMIGKIVEWSNDEIVKSVNEQVQDNLS